MFAFLQKYISIGLIASILFFTNSGFLHAFSSSHENSNIGTVIEHSHSGIKEMHIANVLEPTEDNHCINLQVYTLPHSISVGVISGEKHICSTIDFIALAQSEGQGLDTYTYNAYYPGPTLESFGHLLIGERVLVL